jgi:hypothetical protein
MARSCCAAYGRAGGPQAALSSGQRRTRGSDGDDPRRPPRPPRRPRAVSVRRWTSSVIERAAGIGMRQLSNRGAAAMMTVVVVVVEEELEDSARRGVDQRYRTLPSVGTRRPAATHPGAGRASGTRPSPARPALDPGAEGRRVAPTDEFRSNAGSVSAARTSEDKRTRGAAHDRHRLDNRRPRHRPVR